MVHSYVKWREGRIIGGKWSSQGGYCRWEYVFFAMSIGKIGSYRAQYEMFCMAKQNWTWVAEERIFEYGLWSDSAILLVAKCKRTHYTAPDSDWFGPGQLNGGHVLDRLFRVPQPRTISSQSGYIMRNTYWTIHLGGYLQIDNIFGIYCIHDGIMWTEWNLLGVWWVQQPQPR